MPAATAPSPNGIARPSNLSSPAPSQLLPSPASSAARQTKAAAAVRPKPPAESKSPAVAPPMHQESNMAARHAHDRLLYLMAAFVGQEVSLTLHTSERFTGIFSAVSLDGPDACYMLKMARRASSVPSEQSNGSSDPSSAYVGYGDDHVMSFDARDVVCLDATKVTTDRIQSKLSNGSSFRTDTDISGNLEVNERRLEAWTDASAPAQSLSMNGSGLGTWDQFAANEQRFGLKTDYDETMYTTAIDRSAPSYKERAARADRLAREIEQSEVTNSHVAEERNLVSAEINGMDEEARFSGVARNFPSLAGSGSDRYTPPARRAPTGQPTVTGAPVDPAIISASMVRPVSSKAPNAPPNAARSSSPPGRVAKENDAPKPSTGSTVAPDVEAEVNEASAKEASAEAPSASSQAMKTLPRNTPALTRIQGAASGTQPTATANVENELRDAFKSWSAGEKLKASEVQRQHQELQKSKQRREREHKFNDLKMFSTNFKLKSAVPHDILGILARDKEKQREIERRAEQQRSSAASAVSPTTSASPPPNPVASNAAIGERQLPKGGRVAQPSQTQQAGRFERPAQAQANVSTPRMPGQLGQRLLAQQQSNGRGFNNPPVPIPVDPRAMPPPPPSSILADHASARAGGVTSPGKSLSPFNVEATEFKPNPAASSFLPGDGKSGSVSPARGRAHSKVKERSVNQTPFFASKKPDPAGKKSVREAFNPIKRMKKEAIDAGKSKDYAANGGIPKGFQTSLTWPTSAANENLSYKDIANRSVPAVPLGPAGALPLQQQHQQHHMPVQTHPNYYSGGPRTPNMYRGGGHQGQGREYFEEHRMHPGSQQSSVHPSPSMRQPILAHPQQMGMHSMPPHMMYGPQNPGPGRQFAPYMSSPQVGFVAPQMAMSHSNQGQYMAVPQNGQMPMYSPTNGPLYAVPTPQGQVGYASPRQAPMMMHQGSNHMQMPQQFAYQGQPNGPGLMHQQQMNMRGGTPMMQAGSYGSPGMHMQHNRGQHQFAGGNYPQQQMNPVQQQQMMHPQMIGQPGPPLRFPSDQADSK